MESPSAQDILDFWFGPPEVDGSFPYRPQWFVKDSYFDEQIRERFAKIHKEIPKGLHQDWEKSPESLLALIIVTDQFSRNLYRNQGEAFDCDALALMYARKMLSQRWDLQLNPVKRWFAYLPFEHSEDLDDQEISLMFYTELQQQLPDTQVLEFAQRHYNIIKTFGRFPHRNELLGRESTAEELEFLRFPGSRF